MLQTTRSRVTVVDLRSYVHYSAFASSSMWLISHAASSRLLQHFPPLHQLHSHPLTFHSLFWSDTQRRTEGFHSPTSITTDIASTNALISCKLKKSNSIIQSGTNDKIIYKSQLSRLKMAPQIASPPSTAFETELYTLSPYIQSQVQPVVRCVKSRAHMNVTSKFLFNNTIFL